jgi:O-antigen ligase
MLTDVGVQFAGRRDVILISGGAMVVAVALGLGAVVSPPVAIAGAGAALFATIAFRSLTAGLAIFMVLTFFDRTTVLTQSGLSPVRLAGLVIALIWAIYAFNRLADTPMLIREYPAFALGTIVFTGWSFASALWSTDGTLAITTTFRLALSAILVFIVFSAVREPRHVHWLVWAFVAGVFFAQIIGFLHLEPAQGGRLQGGFTDPNQLASVDVTGMVIAAFAFVAARGRSIRWIFFLCAGLFCWALFRTDSQAGIVALGVALTLGIAFAGRARRLAAIWVTAFLLIGSFYYTFITKPVLLTTITSSQNVGARESLWRVAEQATKDNPLLGVGAGNFIRVAPSYTLDNLDLPRFDIILSGHVVHNTYLEVLTELGPLGLLLLLGLIAGNFTLGVRAVRRFERAGEWELEMLTRGILIGTAAMLTASAFATATYGKQLWFLLALGPALAGLAARIPIPPAEMDDPPWLSPRHQPDLVQVRGLGPPYGRRLRAKRTRS